VILAQLSDPHVLAGPEGRASAAALAAGVAAVLALRPLPVHVLPGNHDERDALRAHFPLAGDGGYRYAADVDGAVTTHVQPIER